MKSILDLALLGWPLALTFASVVVAGRRRERRRRLRLNRAVHELRRPLQALALCAGGSVRGQLDRATAALVELDREINGTPRPVKLERTRAAELVADAVERWRLPAMHQGRALSGEPAANVEVVGEREALARALDNLIANAIEHGGGPIRLEAELRGREVHFCVRDAGVGEAVDRHGGSERVSDARRGHGAAIVAAEAARHGGRFTVERGGAGTSAAIALPAAHNAQR